MSYSLEMSEPVPKGFSRFLLYHKATVFQQGNPLYTFEIDSFSATSNPPSLKEDGRVFFGALFCAEPLANKVVTVARGVITLHPA